MVNNIWDELLERSEKLQTLPGSLRSLRNTDSADNIALMGGYTKKSFQDFEKTVFENYSSNNNSQLFASEEYREDIKESDKIHEDSVFFFESPESNRQISDLFVNSYNRDETIAFGPKEYLEELTDFSPDKVKGFYRE